MIVPTYESSSKEQNLIISKLQQENQELKKQLSNDHQIKMKRLQQENEELKKQLSNSHQMKNQQKEFIEWLEKEIQRQEDYAVSLGLTIDYGIAEYTSGKIDALKESLSKYKEIIGVKDE